MTDSLSGPIPVIDDAPHLPSAIRHHLGKMLGSLYEPVGSGVGEDSERLAALMARLEAALDTLDGRDERAFRAGFLEMVPRLHKFAMSLTKNPTLADDLVQDTLMRGWRSRARFTPGTNLGAWLFTIMRNAFYSLHRRDSREVSDSDGQLAERVATLPEQTGHLDIKDAEAALAKLPSAMREALVLVAVENLSYEEAAAVMNCRIGTVKSRVWRAREQLAAILGFDAAEVGSDSMTLSAMGDAGRALP